MKSEIYDQGHLGLEKLDVYRLAGDLSRFAWNIHRGLSWQIRKVIGDQFLESTDSVGANIAEGYGRFHYLDKIKFFYNGRGSLFESCHWATLLHERKIIPAEEIKKYHAVYSVLLPKLNGLIRTTYRQRAKE